MKQLLHGLLFSEEQYCSSQINLSFRYHKPWNYVFGQYCILMEDQDIALE